MQDSQAWESMSPQGSLSTRALRRLAPRNVSSSWHPFHQGMIHTHEAVGKASSWGGQKSPTFNCNGELSILIFLS